ncbi:MAG: hypothetical protein GC154_19070 [bacterium]|nr:hypothetical protein [bacterium]
MKRYVFPFILVLAAPSLVYAHLNSYSFSTVTIKDEEIGFELRFPYINTIELFAADKNMDQVLSKEEIEAAQQVMYYYFANKIKALSEGRQLQLVMNDARFAEEDDQSFLVIDFTFAGYRKPENVYILCNVSEEVDPYHQNIAVIKKDGKQYLFTFTSSTYLDVNGITPDMEIKDPRLRKRPRADTIQNATDLIQSSTASVDSATP